MISEELKDFLKTVLTSWQVIAVVVAAILYIALVSYAARFRKRKGALPPVRKGVKLKPSKEKKPAKTSGEDDEDKDKDKEDRKK
jgi:hypothetical protein